MSGGAIERMKERASAHFASLRAEGREADATAFGLLAQRELAQEARG